MIPLLVVVFAAALGAQKLDEVCGACHNEPADDFRTHVHFEKGLSCDACHGASKAHREASGHKLPDKVAGPSEQPAVCGACHTAQRKSYEASKHGKLVLARAEKRAAACTTCHGTHAQRKAVAMVNQCGRCHQALPESCRKPAPQVSKVACANCHDAHTLAAKR
ncbi:MAG: cytochrome c3 family protein [Bryobacteraceae bacterium]